MSNRVSFRICGVFRGSLLGSPAMLLLLLSALPAAVQGAVLPNQTVNVTVLSDPFSSDDLEEYQSESTTMTAQVDAAPIATDELQVDGPYWSWDSQVQSLDANGNASGADPASYDAEIGQDDPMVPDAFVDVEFFDDGDYEVSIEAHVIYHVTMGNGDTYDVTGDSPGWVALEADD